MGSVFPVCVGVAADLVFYFQYGGGLLHGYGRREPH